MSILAAVGIGLGALQIGSSIIGGNKKKKAAKKQYEKQKELAEKQFNFNLNEIKDTYVNNAENNYSNIALQMSALTKQFTSAASETKFNATVLSGGASFSSFQTDAENAISSEYKEQMFNLINLRDYNDITLRQNLETTAEQLQLDREAQIFGLKSSLASNLQAANQEQMQGVISGAASIFGTISNMGGTASTLNRTSGESRVSSTITRQKRGIRG